MIYLIDGITPEYTLGTEGSEGYDIGIIFSIGAQVTHGRDIVDRYNYGFSQKGRR